MKTILDEYREWLVGEGKSENTRNRYVDIYDDFLPHLVSRGIDIGSKEGIAKALTKDVVESFKTTIANRPVRNRRTGEIGIYDPNSMRQIRSGINKILEYYDRKEFKLKVGPRDPKEERCPTPEEIRRMLEAAKSDPIKYEKVMWFVHTGRRQGVIRDLLEEDIHLDDQYVTFRKNKGKKKVQQVWIPKEMVDAIRAGNKVRTTPKPKAASYHFISTRGNHINKNDLGNLMDRVAVRAKIAWRIHPHSFRHFKNEDMRRKGADEESRRVFMGWESLAMVQEYSHDDQEQIDAIAQKTVFHPGISPIIVENIPVVREPIDPAEARRIATDNLLRGVWDQETYKLFMANIPTPEQEALR